jgi:hypothetical protein
MGWVSPPGGISICQDGDAEATIKGAKKPMMLLAIALANKMARTIWAMPVRNEGYFSSPFLN